MFSVSRRVFAAHLLEGVSSVEEKYKRQAPTPRPTTPMTKKVEMSALSGVGKGAGSDDWGDGGDGGDCGVAGGGGAGGRLGGFGGGVGGCEGGGKLGG